jgi:hypothetical protein
MKKNANQILEFQYDTLIDRINYCNRVEEVAVINTMMSRNQKLVLYGPRRFGKTSLMQNVIVPDYLKANKNAVAVMVDFMDVTDLQSIERRITQSIVNAFRAHAPISDFIASMAQYFKQLSLTFEIDPSSGQPSASLKGGRGKEQKTIEDFFNAIKQISIDRPVILMLDEFQDISFIPEATALIRKCLQQLTKVPTIISGSKRRLLTNMFASARAPFFGFGDELVLGPIAIDDWHRYFNARLSTIGKKIERSVLQEICVMVNDVPNAISEIGFWIKHDSILSPLLTSIEISNSIDRLIRTKEQTFRYHLAPFSPKEKSIIEGIARTGYLMQPSSKDFLQKVTSNASSIKKTLTKLERLGVVEWELDRGFRLSDPLLGLFVVRNSAM